MCWVLIFSQYLERACWYSLFFSLATIPSSPCFSTALKKWTPALFDVIGKANPACALSGISFRRTALRSIERKFHEVVAIEIQQIEGIEIDRDLLVGRLDVFRPRQMNSRLNQTEVRLPFFIERDNFAIENDGLDRQSCESRGQRGERWLRLFPLRVHMSSLSPILDDDGAHAVELQFEQPVLVVEWLFDQRREHRLRDFGQWPPAPPSSCRYCSSSRSIGVTHCFAFVSGIADFIDELSGNDRFRPRLR